MCAETRLRVSARRGVGPPTPQVPKFWYPAPPGSSDSAAVHMRCMKLSEYLPTVLAALDAEPESRLAIALDSLDRPGDRWLLGLDLVESYVRTTEPDTLAGNQAGDLSRFRRVKEIISGRVKVGEFTYRTLQQHVVDLGGQLHELVPDREARALIQRIAAGEPVLGRLIADRQAQAIRAQGSEDLEESLPIIEDILGSDPDARLAISLEKLSLVDNRPKGLDEVRMYVRDVDLSALSGQLSDDAWRIRRATEILAGRTLLKGMTYWNLRCNIGGLGGSIYNFSSTAEARDLVLRVAAAAPGLADRIAAKKSNVAF